MSLQSGFQFSSLSSSLGCFSYFLEFSLRNLSLNLLFFHFVAAFFAFINPYLACIFVLFVLWLKSYFEWWKYIEYIHSRDICIPCGRSWMFLAQDFKGFQRMLFRYNYFCWCWFWHYILLAPCISRFNLRLRRIEEKNLGRM